MKKLNNYYQQYNILTQWNQNTYFMMPTQEHDNNIALLIASIIIQAGIWVTDYFANITFTQITDTTYQLLKIGALIFSMWASWKVGKKHDK